MRHLLIGCLAALGMAAPAAAADRPPTEQERASIEKVLRANGYTSWEEIEFDDDSPKRTPVWDVDDARGPDGKAYDLKLEPKSYRILRKTPD